MISAAVIIAVAGSIILWRLRPIEEEWNRLSHDGLLAMRQSKYDQSRASLKSAYTLASERLLPNRLTVESLYNLALLARAESRSQESLNLLLRACDCGEQCLSCDDPDLISVHQAMGNAYFQNNQPLKACENFRSEIAARKRLFRGNDPAVQRELALVLLAELNAQQFAAAEEIIRSIVAASKSEIGVGDYNREHHAIVASLTDYCLQKGRDAAPTPSFSLLRCAYLLSAMLPLQSSSRLCASQLYVKKLIDAVLKVSGQRDKKQSEKEQQYLAEVANYVDETLERATANGAEGLHALVLMAAGSQAGGDSLTSGLIAKKVQQRFSKKLTREDSWIIRRVQACSLYADNRRAEAAAILDKLYQEALAQKDVLKQGRLLREIVQVAADDSDGLRYTALSVELSRKHPPDVVLWTRILGAPQSSYAGDPRCWSALERALSGWSSRRLTERTGATDKSKSSEQESLNALMSMSYQHGVRLFENGQYRLAISALRSALAMGKRGWGMSSAMRLDCLHLLGEALLEDDSLAASERVLKELLGEQKKSSGGSRGRFANAKAEIGQIYKKRGMKKESINWMKQAVFMLEEAAPLSHDDALVLVHLRQEYEIFTIESWENAVMMSNINWSRTTIGKDGKKQTRYWDGLDHDYTRRPAKRADGRDEVTGNSDGTSTVHFEPKSDELLGVTRNLMTNEITTTYDGGYSYKINLNLMKMECINPDGTKVTYFNDSSRWRKPVSVSQNGDNTRVTFGSDSVTKEMTANKTTGESQYKFNDGREIHYAGYNDHWNIIRFKQGSTELSFKYDKVIEAVSMRRSWSSYGELTSVRSSDGRTDLKKISPNGSHQNSYSGTIDGKSVCLTGNVKPNSDGGLTVYKKDCPTPTIYKMVHSKL